MLEKRKPPSKPSREEIDNWMQEMHDTTGFPYKRVSPTHLQVGMHNHVSEYPMDIKDQDEWMSFAARLTRDVEGRKKDAFHKGLLEKSGDLNGAHLGIQGDDVIVSREEPTEGLDQLSFYRSIRIVDAAVEEILPKVLKEIDRDNLKPKRK